MKTKIFSMVFAILMLCASMTTVFAITQGTNGDELHVAEAQELEIQLGTEWSDLFTENKKPYGFCTLSDPQ